VQWESDMPFIPDPDEEKVGAMVKHHLLQTSAFHHKEASRAIAVETALVGRTIKEARIYPDIASIIFEDGTSLVIRIHKRGGLFRKVSEMYSRLWKPDGENCIVVSQNAP
jgi:hypothetical protein